MFYNSTSTICKYSSILGLQARGANMSQFPCLAFPHTIIVTFGERNRNPGLGMYNPGSIVNAPNVCDNCLNKITPQDEQDIQNSKGLIFLSVHMQKQNVI